MQPVPFYIVDVFANAPYKGNQLAVFLPPEDLTTHQMQQMAQEIGFAESSFILSWQASTQGFACRFFTVEYEVPFAGHPTLGTAYVLQQFVLQKPVPELSLHLKVGQIPVTFTYSHDTPDFLLMRQINPVFGKEVPQEELAQLIGLPQESLHPSFPVQEVSTGLPFLLIPLQKLEDIQRLKLQPDQLFAFLQHHGLYKTQRPDGLSVALYFFCPQTYSADHQVNARMLALENGQVIEDAATGSANGCFLAYLLKHRYFGEGPLDLLVEQGYELKRDSTIKLQGSLAAEEQYDLQVGGQVQLIAKGEWYAH
ncbi:PhzF family phenazine biosynthesis protein [Rufibacter glacialis]|uniref:PhzF family phenazine biosynthesis protein n=1 Tax=Rufibacter glacialis TaxID=1259555 RepID=A0A5M8Q9E0_9BACT|nr:PhzF family phenazine biosynthesis protein [Rufibacter glacialis]KAA6432555.1 PhzF family phenazine biosynthesis protein [Rufibacter glacialis]GGK79777.1 phenazine biosynthesis protein [Rufibacter glacialis]